MLIKDKHGVTRKARIAPAFWTVLADYDGQERAFEFPSTTQATWELDIIEASDEERALMREHNILPTEHTLFLVDDETGERHEVHIEFEPNLIWARLGCASARDIADGDAFNRCRLVAASPADVKLLRLFGFDPPGLEEIENRLKREEPLKRAA